MRCNGIKQRAQTALSAILLVFSFFVPLPSLAGAPQGYYDKAVGLSGVELIDALHNILDGHKVLPYTKSGNDNWHDGLKMDVWESLVYTDSACPESVPDCGLIHLLYLDQTRHISQANRGGGANDAWDREHVWPKSRGFKKKNQSGYTDLHHLRPADRNINSSHSNYGYDVGGKIIEDKLIDGTSVETTARLDTASTSFEPPDRAKGQVARMLFYMAVRYESADLEDGDKMPDLVLKDDNQRVKEPWIGDLCTLIQWHNMFGPSDFERRRNDRVMEVQGNRNPFIDEPGWANLIWAHRCSDDSN